MNRRSGDRRGSDLSPAEQIAMLRAAFSAVLPWSWVEPDPTLNGYTVDGVSGKVASLVDLVAAGTGIRAITANHAFVQATGANQVPIPSPSGPLRSRYAGLFSGGQWYDSNSTGAAWKLAHDGSGFESFYVFVPRASAGINILLSEVQTAVQAGVAHYFHNTGAATLTIYNASGAAAYDSGAVAAGLVVGTGARLSMRHATASTPDAELLSGATVIASGAVAAPSAAAAANPARLGAAAVSGALPANMDLAHMSHFNRVLTADERAVVANYLATFGV